MLTPSVAFGFEPGIDGRIAEPRTPQTFGNAYRLGLPDQRHLERRWRGSVVGHAVQRRWSIVGERHRLLLTLDPDCYPS
jgi:hypothetical protein